MSAPKIGEDVFNTQLAEEMAKRTDKLRDQSIDIAERLKQAREFMAWSAAHVRGSWLEWQDEANQANRHMTEFRMAFERESRSIKATARDISEFFNSADYLKAHATLKETVNLLDQFATLKANGTLDAFADFILKVSCK